MAAEFIFTVRDLKNINIVNLLHETCTNHKLRDEELDACYIYCIRPTFLHE